MLNKVFSLKILISSMIFLFCFSLTFTGIVHNTNAAPENESTSSQEQLKNSEQTPTTSEQSSENTSTNIDKQTKDLIRGEIWKIVKRFQTAMNRLANIANRISSRNEKMKKEGLLTTERSESVTKKVTAARKEISSAGDDIILAAAEIKQVFNGTSALKAYNSFKDYTEKSKSSIKKAKEKLRQSVEIMKNAQ